MYSDWRNILLLSILTSVAALFTLSSQERVEIVLYDVEHLYDTIGTPRNDLFQRSNTTDNLWSGERYTTKIKNIAKVLDSLDAPIVALIGVESEAVVRDLIVSSQLEYCYVYRSLNYFDDLDCALLYYGDYLVVEQVETSNYIFTVKGVVDTLPIELSLTRRGAKLRNFESATPAGLRVVMGSLSRQDLKRLKLQDPLQSIARHGVGDTYSDSRWYFKNRIGIDASTSAHYQVDCGVYCADWLLANALRRPLPTFLFGRYVGGYSSHLPIYMNIDRQLPPE